jgi:hypothetical protein
MWLLELLALPLFLVMIMLWDEGEQGWACVIGVILAGPLLVQLVE